MLRLSTTNVRECSVIRRSRRRRVCPIREKFAGRNGNAQEGVLATCVVVDIRQPTVVLSGDVVGVAPAGWCGAVGPHASAVSNCESFSLGWAEEAHRTPQVEDFALWSEDDSADDSVADEFLSVGGGTRFVTVVHPRGTGAGVEVLRSDHHIHGGRGSHGAGYFGRADPCGEDTEKNIELAL